MWIHRPVCMWRPEEGIRLVLSAYFFEAGSSPKPRALASSAKLKASKPQKSVSDLIKKRVTGIHETHSLFIDC